MATMVNTDLQVPYAIGRFIASQVPYLDSKVGGDPWAEHKGLFEPGPSPWRDQMSQGILLEVDNHNNMPHAIYTRYGRWEVLGSNSGSFKEIFKIAKTKMNLQKIEALSTPQISLWAVQTWDGKELPKPIKAKMEEFIPYEEAIATYEAFLKV